MLPPYEVFPVLSDEKVLLRAVTSADIDQLISISVYDGIRAANREDALEMQARIDGNYRDGESVHWCIVNRASDEIVGTCGYYRGLDKGSGELGCILLPSFKGQGFMTPALQLAIDFGRDKMGLKRIWAATDKENERAVKLLEKLGFVKTGESDDELEFELREA